ncbi:MAG: VIT and VWA domain-containing protein [Spirochaetes bacterium]|nr:VIT and VWA domain-containing protein [Spirochaetota bacterium]
MKILRSILFVFVFIILTGGILSADGFIIVRPDPMPQPYQATPFPMQVKYHHVDVQINESSAKTSIDQVFYNPSGMRMEGEYLFPIPKNAVIKKFSMYINGKEMPAELLEAKKARKIYEDIVRQMKDPALLEYQELSLFRVRVYPIEPYSEKRVKISYHEILNKDNGTFEYNYPLNTEKFSSAPLKETVINVELKSKDKIKNVYCPTHDAEIVRKNDHNAKISYEENNSKPDRDFKVYYDTDQSKVGVSVLTFKESGKDGYFFLSATPGINIKGDEIEEKDITFVLDVSGSMAGEKIKQARKSLLFCINNLNKGDRFEIIRFSTEASDLFGKLVEADEKNLKNARQFIQDIQAIGGTNIEEALKMALGIKSGKRPYIIVFMTDGKPTIGETKEEHLLNEIKKVNNNNTRIFTFGIGTEINTHLLDKITETTRAYRTYIAPEEDIEIKISNFYQKIQSPVLSDIKVRFGDNIETFKMYPKDLPDLFKGSSLTLLGRFKGKGNTTVVLTGKLKGKMKEYSFKIDFDDEDQNNLFIPSLWAARRIGYLLDQVRLHGEDKELVDEITMLAREYGIITPYTSYLILEDEEVRVSRNEMDDRDQTLRSMIPESSSFAKKNKMEYMDMKEKSGAGSVQASEEFQEMNKADNVGQARPGRSRLNYKDKSGTMQNVTQMVKNVQGRAFYNSGNQWVDSRVQSTGSQKAIRIKFASKKYFDLLKKNPTTGQLLSLGRNIRFVFKKKLYEIYE